jgi:ABC-type sugar transport system substrate-binding protein
VLSSRRIAAALAAIGALAVAGPVAGASAAAGPAGQPAATDPFFTHLQAAQGDFVTSITAAQSGFTHLGDAWVSLLNPRPYHTLAS